MPSMMNKSFFHEQSICATRYQINISLKTTTWICSRRDATLTLLLDGVIFDVIGDSLNVNTSPYPSI